MLRCLTCGKRFDPDQSPAMPFCSERCRTIDLGRWLDETNRIPLVDLPDGEEEEGSG